MPDPTTPTTSTTTTTAETTSAAVATTATTLKPGHKTTEFALSLASIVLTACFATDVFPTGTLGAKIAIIAAITLTSIGYTVVRGNVKAGAAMVLLFALAFAPASFGCGGRLGDAAGVASHGFVDCMKPEPQKMLGELRPVFQDVLRNATGGDGKVDRDVLRAAGMKLASDATRCAFSSVIAEVLRPHSLDPNAPQSAALEVDQAQLRAEYDAIRDDFWGGQSFKLEAGPP